MSVGAGPQVYRALSAVQRALAKRGIAKAHHNKVGDYAFRSIDDIYAALAPLLARHRICVFPRVLNHSQQQLRERTGGLLLSSIVHATFDFVSVVDGSRHSAEALGEALDSGDKATAKAMTAAYKTAIIQTFAIPVAGAEDPDAAAPTILSPDHLLPEQGWSAWAADIASLIQSCETVEAVDRVQATYRERLRALSLTDAALFAEVGRSTRERKQSLRSTPATVPAGGWPTLACTSRLGAGTCLLGARMRRAADRMRACAQRYRRWRGAEAIRLVDDQPMLGASCRAASDRRGRV